MDVRNRSVPLVPLELGSSFHQSRDRSTCLSTSLQGDNAGGVREPFQGPVPEQNLSEKNRIFHLSPKVKNSIFYLTHPVIPDLRVYRRPTIDLP